jgi:hypothetical protein
MKGLLIMGIPVKKKLIRGGIAAAAVGTLAATALTGAGSALAAPQAPKAPAAATAGGYQFVEIGSTRDRTFNQLLGINNNGRIAGYFGSGVAGHPNKGYLISAPYAPGDFVNENYPHSVQTQVTGLNDNAYQVGFYSTQNKANPGDDNNFGFWVHNGNFHKVVFPTGNNQNPPVDQLLGINNHNIAVGFYLNGSGVPRAYEFNTANGKFTLVTEPGAPTGGAAPATTATGINNNGDVSGIYNTKAGVTDGFLKLRGGDFITIAVPGASMTQAFGVNDHDVVVGTYTVGTGNNAMTHGFLYRPGHGFTLNIDDPNGVGTTVLNGINNENDIVGFYTDSAGNTDGLVGYPPF